MRDAVIVCVSHVARLVPAPPPENRVWLAAVASRVFGSGTSPSAPKRGRRSSPVSLFARVVHLTR